MKSVEQMLVLERITAVNERQTASTDDTMTLILKANLFYIKLQSSQTDFVVVDHTITYTDV